MEYLILSLKVILGLSIINVWTINKNKASQWRGGNAKNIFEEFEVYGLPKWMVYVVGVSKVTLALLLLISIEYNSLVMIASLGLAVFLSGSILMHLKIKDSIKKSIPAAFFLLLSLFIYLQS